MTLAINKNVEWNPNLKINESELVKPDVRETHAPLFCHHSQKFNEGCKILSPRVKAEHLLTYQAAEVMSSTKTCNGTKQDSAHSTETIDML